MTRWKAHYRTQPTMYSKDNTWTDVLDNVGDLVAVSVFVDPYIFVMHMDNQLIKRGPEGFENILVYEGEIINKVPMYQDNGAVVIFGFEGDDIQRYVTIDTVNNTHTVHEIGGTS